MGAFGGEAPKPRIWVGGRGGVKPSAGRGGGVQAEGGRGGESTSMFSEGDCLGVIGDMSP